MFIYALAHPEYGEYRYVGKARHLEARLATHYSLSRAGPEHASASSRSCYSDAFLGWVASMSLRDFLDGSVLLEETPDPGSGLVELSYMLLYAAEGHRLFNREHLKFYKADMRPWQRDPVILRARAEYRNALAGLGGDLKEIRPRLSFLVRAYCRGGWRPWKEGVILDPELRREEEARRREERKRADPDRSARLSRERLIERWKTSQWREFMASEEIASRISMALKGVDHSTEKSRKTTSGYMTQKWDGFRVERQAITDLVETGNWAPC